MRVRYGRTYMGDPRYDFAVMLAAVAHANGGSVRIPIKSIEYVEPQIELDVDPATGDYVVYYADDEGGSSNDR